MPALDLAAERLSKLFPSSDETRTLLDAEIEEVATLLEGQNEVHSQAPRAYIVLWIIGRLDILGDLLKSGFSDFCFPVESTSLPPSLDPAVRRAIVQTQHVILTKSVDLEKGENGKHRHFGKEDPLPFKTLRRLGAGGYSQVDLIKSRISCKQYALKRIPRRTAFWNNSKQAVRQFAAEMQLIKALKHRHIVQFVGSFTDPKYLGMIISPVADMNLAEYMDLMAAQKAPPNLTSLRSFFGCLATALQYLHDQSIRHRDIKPQNILIDGGNVLFTDFGLSKDYSDHAGSTTSGVTAMTPRYSAPEVAAGDPRNTSADIWSLGCVFLEMVVVLKHQSTEWMRGYFSDHGTKEPYASRNPDATSTLIARLREVGLLRDNKMLDLSQSMLSFDRESRPTAAEVVTTITTPSGDDISATMFCGICCLSEEALSDSNDSLADDIQTTPEGPRQPFPRHDSTKKIIRMAMAPALESSGQLLRLREDSLAQDLTNTPEASSTKASTTDNSSNSYNGSALSEWDSSFEYTIEHTIDNDFSLTPFTVDYSTLHHNASAVLSFSSAPEVMEEDSVPIDPLELHPMQGSSKPGFQPQIKSSASDEAADDCPLVSETSDLTERTNYPEQGTSSDQDQLLSLSEAITDPSLFPGAEEIHHTWANNPWEEQPRVVQTEEPESQENFESGELDSSSIKAASQKPRSRALMRKAFSAVQLSSEKSNNQSQGAWWRLVRGRGGSEGKIPNDILDQSLKSKKEITNLSPSVISGGQSQPPYPIFGNRLHKCVFTGVSVQYPSGVSKEARVAYLPIVVVECVSFLKTAGKAGSCIQSRQQR